MLRESEYLCDLKLFRGYIPRVMGTKMDFITLGTPEEYVVPLWNEVCEMTEKLDAIFNRFSPESEVWAFNHCAKGVPFTCSDDFYQLLVRALSFWYDTEGLFDITKGKMLEFQTDGKLLTKSV